MLHNYNVKLPSFTFYGGHEHRQHFAFTFSEPGCCSPLESAPEKFTNTWQIDWHWIRVIKFVSEQIQFLSDIFVAIAFVAYAPY